jgi:hypothetical protein
MNRLTIAALACFALAGPVTAAPWGTDYNMGTFAAGGGSDEDGWLSLECGDPEGGLDNYGELYLLFTPAKDASFNKKQPLTYLTFTIGSDSFDLPIELEAGSSNTFAYVREAEGATLTQGLVLAMRNGDRVQISLDGAQLGDISLEGSNAALEAIDECIRYRS